MKALFVIKQYIIDPLGISYLSSYLKAAGHEVGIYSPGESTDGLAADILCYSITTGSHVYYSRLNMQMRELFPAAVSIFGGAHCTFFPEFANTQGVDAVVRGEGFEAIVDIANALRDNKALFTIQNIVIGDNIQPLRPLIDKNKLLLPDRDLIYNNTKNYKNPIRNVMCSFGCNFSCPYCYNVTYKKMYGQRIAQVRDVDNIMAEIDDLRRFPCGLIFFQDDIFPMYNDTWLESFCDEYTRHGIPFHIQTRVEYMTEERIEKLKAVGLHGITFAIESGNELIRYGLLKRPMSDEDIINAANLCHKYGVNLRTENMIGVPYESRNTAMQTLALNVKCDPTIAWASVFQPYPGTELGDLCLRSRIFDGDIDGIDESFFDTYKIKSDDAKFYERLQKLFSLAAKSRFVRLLLPVLLKLSLTKHYKLIYNITKRKLYNRLYKI